MTNFEKKARKKIRRMLEAQAEGRSLEVERRRQLASLFESEDLGDQEASRKLKQLVRQIDEKMATTTARIGHYKGLTLKNCGRAIDTQVAAWKNFGKAEYQRKIAEAESEAGKLLGRAVAILSRVGPVHHPFISNLSRLFEPLGPNHLPIAGSRVLSAFKSAQGQPVCEIIDRSHAGVLDRAGGDSIARQNTVTKLFGTLLREECGEQK